MKYDNLLDFIQSIIQSPKYMFKIKLFDKNGNLTISLENTKWIVLVNDNIMIEMPEDNNKLTVWKDSSNENPNIIEIIHQIRKQAILNGVSVSIENYIRKDRDTMKNIIKKNLENSVVLHKDKEDMEEVKESKLASAYFNIMSSVRAAKKPSDAVITEGLKIARTIKLLNECSREIASLKCFEGLDVKSFNNGMFLCKTLKDVNNYINNYKDKALIKALTENLSKFKYVGKFVKNRYSSGIMDAMIEEGAMKFYPNLKLFRKEIVEENKLQQAYNALYPLITEAKCRTDIIRAIKENKICETYNVKKSELLNYWLNTPAGSCSDGVKKEIKYVAETLSGNKINLPCANILGVRLIVEHINKGGKVEDKVVNDIIKAVEVYENTTNFLKFYKKNDTYKKIASNICLENSFNLHSSLADFVKNYHEIKASDKHTKILEAKLRTNHPTLMYISEELAAYENEDINILSEGLKKFVSPKKLDKVVMDIVDNGLNIGMPITEGKDNRSVLEKLYMKLCENLNDIKNLAVSSSIFYLIHKPIALNENQKQYIKRLIKYCR